MKRVFVQSFGCRASQADGAAIETALIENGYIPANNAANAELIVLNTCTVTHNADVDTKRTIRGLHRDHPNLEILVTGCHAQRAPEELAALEGVRWVVGNTHKDQIPQIVSEQTELYHGRIFSGEIARQIAFQAMPVRGPQEDRARPNLKIQDGCSNRCSFCIIPNVRGRSRSANADSVVEEIQKLGEEHAEIVLTGINLGRWGRDLPGNLRFPDLLRRVLRETNARRIRISSVEPMDWSSDLLELVTTEERIAKHVHLPLQSGSDAVLKRMFRKYRTRHYAGRIQLARQNMPDAAIGADVMTGFPGETDGEFEETVSFIQQQPFTYLHVFTYSERPGTPAANYANSVPMPVRHERTRILREISAAKNLEFRRLMLGKRLSAVTLEQPRTALTSNFLRIELSQHFPSNQIISVAIGSITGSGLREQALLPVLA